MTISKKKFFISVSVVALANLVLVFAAVFLWSVIGAKKSSVSLVKRQLASYEKRIEQVNKLNDTLRIAEENYSKIKPMFINSNSMVDFIEDMESLAESAGVSLEIKGVRFDEKQNKPVFTMALAGSFSDIYHYTVLLENTIYKVEFDGVDIGESSSGDIWREVLELKLLSFQNEEI